MNQVTVSKEEDVAEPTYQQGSNPAQNYLFPAIYYTSDFDDKNVQSYQNPMLQDHHRNPNL